MVSDEQVNKNRIVAIMFSPLLFCAFMADMVFGEMLSDTDVSFTSVAMDLVQFLSGDKTNYNE